jgi:lipoyl-dependent peroxiredoxin
MPTFTRQAELQWEGEITGGEGIVSAATGAFRAGATFPSTLGDPPGRTTPEELFAAAHAVCFGIGLRSLIARRGGRARRVAVTATVTADKGPRGIRITSAHLAALVEGLQGIDDDQLQQIARETEEGCTISVAVRGNVTVTCDIVARP